MAPDLLRSVVHQPDDGCRVDELGNDGGSDDAPPNPPTRNPLRLSYSTARAKGQDAMRSPHARNGGRPRFWWPREIACACLAASALAASPARATTTLTVDLSTPIGPVTHAANGSLYGVIEQKPADLANLLAPLHPNMFNNPAVAGSGYQQPVGDAIVV